jgi:hypothetical protein
MGQLRRFDLEFTLPRREASITRRSRRAHNSLAAAQVNVMCGMGHERQNGGSGRVAIAKCRQPNLVITCQKVGSILAHAYAQCRSNKGAPGVDGQDFADIEAYGVQRCLCPREFGEPHAKNRTCWRPVHECTGSLHSAHSNLAPGEPMMSQKMKALSLITKGRWLSDPPGEGKIRRKAC